MKTKKQTVQFKNLKFTAIVKNAEEGGFYAYCPVLPGCVTQGETYAETVANIEDAIKGYVEVMIAKGDPLPAEAQESTYIIDVPLPVPTNKLRFA